MVFGEYGEMKDYLGYMAWEILVAELKLGHLIRINNGRVANKLINKPGRT